MFYQTIDQNLNYKLTPAFLTETKYAWIHVTCAHFLPNIKFSFRSAIWLTKLKEESFLNTCIICHQKSGCCVQCAHPGCQIYMHAECAWRAGFHLELPGKLDLKDKVRDKIEYSKNINKIYCEPHRPFKLI